MDDNKGNIYYYGSSCGVNAASLKDSKELKKEVKKIDFVNSYSNLKTERSQIKAMKSAINKGFFSKTKNAHFIGIGGIGMSGIARIMLNMGFEITGSDLKRSDVTEALKNEGCKISPV